MERYKNLSGKSGIYRYEIGNDYIRVQFSSGQTSRVRGCAAGAGAATSPVGSGRCDRFELWPSAGSAGHGAWPPQAPDPHPASGCARCPATENSLTNPRPS